MSDPPRIALVGATGLVGRAVAEAANQAGDVLMLVLARRGLDRQYPALMEPAITDPANWPHRLAEFRPEVLICALGTTWRKAGRDERAFRAVDHLLVVEIARAAHAGGAGRAVVVSSVGASLSSGSFYLRTKAEMERDVDRVGFERLDILRPGLLRGPRMADRRLKERAAIALSPVVDRLLGGSLGRFRSISAHQVGGAALTLAYRDTRGTTIHHNDDIQHLARRIRTG